MISVKEYFAAHAPETIPQWFQVNYQPKLPDLTHIPNGNVVMMYLKAAQDYPFCDFKPEPDGTLNVNMRDLKSLDKLEVDIILDFRKKMQDYATSKDDESRYFAWRWYYAEQMFRMSKEPPI